MGTETAAAAKLKCIPASIHVKLNNPLMGTETKYVQGICNKKW